MVNTLIALLTKILYPLSLLISIIVGLKTAIKGRFKWFIVFYFITFFLLMSVILTVNKSSGIIYTKFTKFERINDHYYFSGNQISNYYTPLIFSNNKKMKFRYDIDKPDPNNKKTLFSGFAMSFPNYSESLSKYEQENKNYLDVTLNQQSMTQYFANFNFDKAVNDEGGEKCTYKPPGWLGFDYHNEKISNPQSLTFILDFSQLEEDIIFKHQPSYKIVKDDKDKDTPCREDGEAFLLEDINRMTQDERHGGKGIWVANIKGKIPDDWVVIVKWKLDN